MIGQLACIPHNIRTRDHVTELLKMVYFDKTKNQKKKKNNNHKNKTDKISVFAWIYGVESNFLFRTNKIWIKSGIQTVFQCIYNLLYH